MLAHLKMTKYTGSANTLERVMRFLGGGHKATQKPVKKTPCTIYTQPKKQF